MVQWNILYSLIWPTMPEGSSVAEPRFFVGNQNNEDFSSQVICKFPSRFCKFRYFLFSSFSSPILQALDSVWENEVSCKFLSYNSSQYTRSKARGIWDWMILETSLNTCAIATPLVWSEHKQRALSLDETYLVQGSNSHKFQLKEISGQDTTTETDSTTNI